MDILVTEFGGNRNDRERKLVSENFFYDSTNINFNSLSGADKIGGMSSVFSNSTNEKVNGLFEYVYEDLNNQSVKENILVIGGNVYKNIFINPVQIYGGLNATALCSFTVLNDRLFISNGVDFPIIYDGSFVWQMGAPRAAIIETTGNLNGTYYYAMTMVIGGVESRFGTISNKLLVGNEQVLVEIPLGPTDVDSRKIYRTTADSNQLKLLTTISDNVTLTYTDNTLDSNLGVNIIGINDEMVRPKFLQTNNSRLVGGVNLKNPTLLYTTETNKEFFTNLRGTINVSGVANDNSPLVGISQDYNRIVAASSKQIYTVDLSEGTPTATQSRANVGCANGYTMTRVPDNQYQDLSGNMHTFPGGVMFVSSLNDVRIFNGNFALPIATTLDNLRTENWSSFIQNKFSSSFTNGLNISCEFFDYKYHLCIDSEIYIFDIRGNKWSKYELSTENNTYVVSAIQTIGNILYLGLFENGKVVQLYNTNQFLEEDFTAKIESSDILASEDLKYFKEIHFYFTNVTTDAPTKVKVIIESDTDTQIETDINLNGGYFDSRYYNLDNYVGSSDDIDYRVVHINRFGRWISFEIESSDTLNFRGYRLISEPITNKEAL